MRLRVVVALSIFGLAYITLPSTSFADDAFEIIVTIGDTTLTAASPATSLIIPNQVYTHAGSGGSITIANSGGIARVEQTPPVADGINDALRIMSLRITANNSSVNNFPITFRRRMTQGPNTSGQRVWYKTTAIGTFQQGGGNSILWGQFVKNPLPGVAFRALGARQHTPGPLNFNATINANHEWTTPPNLALDRVLKVEFTFNLANGSFLDLANGIRMFSSLIPDPPTDPDPEAESRNLGAARLQLPFRD